MNKDSGFELDGEQGLPLDLEKEQNLNRKVNKSHSHGGSAVAKW